MSDPKSTTFDSFAKLPPRLIPTSFQVMHYVGDYVKNDSDGTEFDWDSFMQSLDQYKGDDLTFDADQIVTIDHQDSTVKTMADQIVDFLSKALSIAMSTHDINELTETIKTTFTNLKEKSSYGFLNFYKSTNDQNSSWEYRIHFAFPNPYNRDYFSSMVASIILEADITEESEWWGLDVHTTKNFSAKIHALELVVQKGFRNPHK